MSRTTSHRTVYGLTAVLLLGGAVAARAEMMQHGPPLNQPSGPSAGPMLQKKPAPASPGGGVGQLNPAAVCAANKTPRIININGTQAGIEFKPGDSLNIAGCGFGAAAAGNQVALIGVGPLYIDAWTGENVRAHIDPALSKIPDVAGVSVYLKPNGAPALSTPPAHRFRAARETTHLPLPAALGVYSPIYGAPKASLVQGGIAATVERNAFYIPYCPSVTTQSQLVDFWPLKAVFFEQGHAVVGVDYQNMTDQTSEDGDNFQRILVGNGGGATYDAGQHRVVVTFQGHSTYAKRHGLLAGGVQPNVYPTADPNPGSSKCTSRYRVSLTVSGPRGLSPSFGLPGIVPAQP
jgi:hypothetical protein